MEIKGIDRGEGEKGEKEGEGERERKGERGGERERERERKMEREGGREIEGVLKYLLTDINQTEKLFVNPSSSTIGNIDSSVCSLLR